MRKLCVCVCVYIQYTIWMHVCMASVWEVQGWWFASQSVPSVGPSPGYKWVGLHQELPNQICGGRWSTVATPKGSNRKKRLKWSTMKSGFCIWAVIQHVAEDVEIHIYIIHLTGQNVSICGCWRSGIWFGIGGDSIKVHIITLKLLM